MGCVEPAELRLGPGSALLVELVRLQSAGGPCLACGWPGMGCDAEGPAALRVCMLGRKEVSPCNFREMEAVRADNIHAPWSPRFCGPF